MAIPTILPCDGCGQLADADHIARRLQRLEWSTRFRPIHVHALLLSATAPDSDLEFLYNPQSQFNGLSGRVLAAMDLPGAGKPPEEILAEFQKRGLILASVLECPAERGADPASRRELVAHHLPHAIARVRRSFKPKRVLVISAELQPFMTQLSESALGCPVFYTPLSVSAAARPGNTAELAVFQAALPVLAAQAT